MTMAWLKSFIVCVTFVICLQVQTSQAAAKLSITILYESFCPDSIKFMEHQLKPAYDSIKDYVEIGYVPFGKAHSEDNGAKFFCQHGPKECKGNRMQSCVIQQTGDNSAQTKFVICQMASSNKLDIKQCAEQAGLSSNIDQCMTTELGTYFQLEAERATKEYNPSFIPTIIYDGEFNRRLQDSSLKDFLGTVCKQLQQRGTNPPGCKQN